MTTGKRPTATRWKLRRLKEHPRQAEMFGDVDEGELEALAENMRRHGLRDPVDVTPDGTVIAGHQRVRAAERLGWREIDVVVRHDLEAEGPEAVERHFVEDNFVRRQLGPLAKARCIRRLMELEEGKSSRKFGFTKKEELKDRIAKRMKLSLRSVNRYLLLLDTPEAVQAAFDRGDLTLVAAGKVALLDESAREDVARRIGAGEKATAAVQKYTRSAQSGGPGKAFGRLVRTLRREVPLVRGHLDEITPGRLEKSAPAVAEAVELLSQLLSVGGGKPERAGAGVTRKARTASRPPR